MALERNGRFSREILRPTAKTKLQVGDILLIDLFGPESSMESLRQQFALEAMPLSGAYFADRSQEIGMAEAIVPADSDLVGQTVIEAEIPHPIWPDGARIAARRSRARARMNEALKVGDTLLLIGPWKDIENLRSGGKDLVITKMPVEFEEVLPAPSKALYALACLGLVVGLMVSGVIPNVQAALIGCLLMGALGCIDFASAYRSIDWKTIVLIVGMLPFSVALERTGGVDLAADGLRALTSGAGPQSCSPHSSPSPRCSGCSSPIPRPQY